METVYLAKILWGSYLYFYFNPPSSDDLVFYMLIRTAPHTVLFIISQLFGFDALSHIQTIVTLLDR